MADYAKFSCPAVHRLSGSSPSAAGNAARLIPIVAAVAALGLAGCNANHGINPPSQLAPGAAPGVVAGPNFPNFNPWNPISYAQTSGYYIGRGKAKH